MKKSNWIAEKA